MRPLTVITGIVLGSCLSITVSLAAVIVIFIVLGTDHPRIAYESAGLATSAVIFLALTAISAASFYTLVKGHQARWWWQGTMWLALVLTVAYYLPDGSFGP